MASPVHGNKLGGLAAGRMRDDYGGQPAIGGSGRKTMDRCRRESAKYGAGNGEARPKELLVVRRLDCAQPVHPGVNAFKGSDRHSRLKSVRSDTGGVCLPPRDQSELGCGKCGKLKVDLQRMHVGTVSTTL